MSVPPRLATWNWWGMPASTAIRVSRSTRAGAPMALASITRIAVPWPRRVVGPEAGRRGRRSPGRCRWRARCRAARAPSATRAPRRPTSSCTVAVATTSAAEGPARPQRLDHHEHPDAVVEALAGDEIAERRAARARGWPRRRGAPARARARRAGRGRSRDRSPRASSPRSFWSSRCTGGRPTTPSRSSRPWTLTRWPTSVRASQPPIGITFTKPRSSTWVTISADLVHVGGEHQARAVALADAHRLPRGSVSTRSQSASSRGRTMSRTRSSRPEVPAASQRAREEVHVRELGAAERQCPPADACRGAGASTPSRPRPTGPGRCSRRLAADPRRRPRRGGRAERHRQVDPAPRDGGRRGARRGPDPAGPAGAPGGPARPARPAGRGRDRRRAPGAAHRRGRGGGAPRRAHRRPRRRPGPRGRVLRGPRDLPRPRRRRPRRPRRGGADRGRAAPRTASTCPWEPCRAARLRASVSPCWFWRGSTCSCSTSRPTTSTSPVSRSWSVSSTPIAAPSSRSPTTAPSSTGASAGSSRWSSPPTRCASTPAGGPTTSPSATRPASASTRRTGATRASGSGWRTA